jgi:hypothetical protein
MTPTTSLHHMSASSSFIGYTTNADTVLPSRARDGQGEARWSASVPEEEWSYLNSTVAITVHFYMHAFVATTPF